jgi:hypothetical protein
LALSTMTAGAIMTPFLRLAAGDIHQLHQVGDIQQGQGADPAGPQL